jgi:hypothetical protein
VTQQIAHPAQFIIIRSHLLEEYDPSRRHCLGTLVVLPRLFSIRPGVLVQNTAALGYHYGLSTRYLRAVPGYNYGGLESKIVVVI